MVDYYYEYGPGFYQRTQGLDPAAVQAEAQKITQGKRTPTEADYRQAASRVPGYNATKAIEDRASISEGFEQRRQEQAKGLSTFQGLVRSGEIRSSAGPQVYTPPPVGLEALKAAELQAARQETARRQSEQATTPGEALAIQRMLRSPTAQFSSQETAQRGYDLAHRYDRSFAPEQVRATLAPQYAPQPQQQEKPRSFFGPAPREQAGIRPSFRIPHKPTSRAEGFYTYGTVRRLEGVSSRLQSGFESTIGYNERSSIPVKAAVGFGSAFTGLPAFAGMVAGAGEAIIRYPSASLRGLPTGFKILSSQVATQARTKPVEFGGSLAGMATIGRFAPKISVPKPSSAGIRALARSETASLGRSKDPWANVPTMRQSAQAAGKELTRKIEFGRTFKEPSGSGVVSMSGKQALISIQQTKTVPQIETKVITGKGYVSEYALQQARTVDEQMIQLARISRQKQLAPQVQKTRIIPLTMQATKQISRTKQISPQITRQVSSQISSQITRQKPITVQKQRQRYVNVPMSIQAQSRVMKSLQAQKPIQIQKQITKQAQVLKPSTIQRTQLKTEARKKQRTPKLSSAFSKRSFKLTGTRKFTRIGTTKTYHQLIKELKSNIKGRK